MFVLAVKTGYFIVEGNTAEGYSIEELENAIAGKTEKEKAGYRLAINGSKKWVKLIKIGDIALQRYNANIADYQAQGGSIETAETMFHSKRICLSPPFPPIWLFPDKQVYLALSDIDFQSDIVFSQVGFIPFDDGIVPVFNVTSIEELYWYDLFRMRAAELRIKRCEDCGSAFVAKTTAIRCDNCRRAGKGEVRKQANLKNDPARKLIKGILNRSANGKRPFMPNNYLNDLARIINNLRKDKKNSPLELLSCLKKWDSWDRTYYKLCRYFRDEDENDNISDYELQNKWKQEYTQFPKTENPERWLSEWCEKAHITMK